MNIEEINLLYFDNDITSLNLFKAAHEKKYQVHTALCVAEVLSILDENEIHVIICNEQSPENTGIELLKSIRELHPDPIRILLTTYKGSEILIDAISQGYIYRYLTKPYSEIDFDNCIVNAYDKYLTTKELKEKIEELKKTNDDLTRFIYSISHELKAPLASAIGVIHLAKLDNLFDAPGGEYWGLLEECCKRLEYQITSSLEYYKNNHFAGIINPIDFKIVIDTLINVHHRANNNSNKIYFNINIDQTLEFCGDSFRVELILSNLISNAIKYQRIDEQFKKVDITVNVSSTEALIKISDNGIGISENDIAKIFKRFYRGKSKSQGTGLGLYIVKEAVEKIKATISVQSMESSGTVFVVKIPNLAFEKGSDDFSIAI